MAVRPLSEAVRQAEEAISGGDYRFAVETCRRVLGQFPEFATAHRLLAEAHLKEGDVAAAELAFKQTLQRDPQSSAAYGALATIAEEQGDIDGALAYARVAWEIMPQRTDLRDRVVSLSARLYGKDRRLHLTRAALTSLHFGAGRWSRAAAEAAAVLADHPTRTDMQLRLAEALWRRGSLSAASNACRAVLESAPSAVMALLILADIERRQGNREPANQLLDRARAIDPDGVRAADLVTVGAYDMAEFMLPATMPEFDDSVEMTAEAKESAADAGAGSVEEVGATHPSEWDISARGGEPVVEDAVRMAIARLGVDAALFDRARYAKARLVESGQIHGDVLLPGVEPPGPTLEMLEQMVRESPDDLDLRRQFAGALLETGAFGRALSEYHWMFRQRMNFDESDLGNLARVAESGGEQQVASHRLLGAIYRRLGNLGMSARHYQLSLAGYRGDAEKEA